MGISKPQIITTQKRYLILYLSIISFFPLYLFLFSEKSFAEPSNREIFHFESIVSISPSFSEKTALAVAKAKVKKEAMLAFSKELAKQSSIQFLAVNDGSSTFSAPNVDAIVREHYFVDDIECSTGLEEVSCKVSLSWQDKKKLAIGILSSMQDTITLDRYVLLISRIHDLLSQYDALSIGARYTCDVEKHRLVKKDTIEIGAELEALDAYEALLKSYKGSWENPKEALRSMEKFLQSAPYSPILLAGASEAFIQLNNPVRALDSINKALKILPEVAYFHDIKGTVLLQQHFPALAGASYAEAIRLDGFQSLYKVHQGYVFYLLGEEEDMCSIFYEACKEGDCSGLSWSRKSGLCSRCAKQPTEK